MYAVHQIEFRHAGRQRFAERLQRNGPCAVTEGEIAQRLWARRQGAGDG